MLTEKENYLKLLHGECPEWIPKYNLLAKVDPKAKPPASVLLAPPFLVQHRAFGKGGTDIWGVEYVPTYETGGATLPKPNSFILKDIRKWRDVIKAPDISGFDWEAIAKKNIEDSGIDRSQTALSFDLHFGYFQHLMSFMGFSDGLCAMFEEPDEVMALLDYLCTFYCTVAEKVIDYYKPDILSIKDDTAAWANTFVSLDMYKEMLVPFYDRQAKFGRDRGLPITFHNCGKCESFIDSLVGIGVTQWDPAQVCNDLTGIKKKYGNKLVIAGGWDARGRLLDPDVTDEEIYEAVRKTFNTLAQGGGYAFCGGFIGPVDDPVVKRKNAAIDKAYQDLAYKFYK